jgi:hypothetical protein
MIDCPGDTITCNCSIISNTENIQLLWRVNPPNFTILYDKASLLGSNDEVNGSIFTSLVDYRDGYIQSILVLTLTNISVNRRVVECGLPGVNNELVSIITTFSGTYVALELCW